MNKTDCITDPSRKERGKEPRPDKRWRWWSSHRKERIEMRAQGDVPQESQYASRRCALLLTEMSNHIPAWYSHCFALVFPTSFYSDDELLRQTWVDGWQRCGCLGRRLPRIMASAWQQESDIISAFIVRFGRVPRLHQKRIITFEEEKKSHFREEWCSYTNELAFWKLSNAFTFLFPRVRESEL